MSYEQAAFTNRVTAGQALARKLVSYHNQPGLLVLALPRGGVPVAAEVAKALNAELEIIPVRKLGVPGNSELAMGAIALGGQHVFNQEIIEYLHLTRTILQAAIDRETKELTRRNEIYRQGRPMPDMANRTVILVDDGLATGATMKAAIAAVRAGNAAHIVVAVPVGAEETCQSLAQDVDELVCLLKPEPFYGVGFGYKDFSQLTDQQVLDCLQGQG